jgi:hypothetical protein
MMGMTRETDDNVTGPEAPADGAPAGDVYQPPRLIYVGNVHALLAGSAISGTPDGPRASMNRVG